MKRKVLIAEDEPALLESYSELIAGLGCECLAARDGNEAIELARAYKPDLVVTDFMMPGRTGLEVIATLKRVLRKTAEAVEDVNVAEEFRVAAAAAQASQVRENAASAPSARQVAGVL
jgi:CheY-like chemotaxis protein